MAKAPTIREFQNRFPTEESCLEHLMRTRYGETHNCGGCTKEARYYRVKARRSYACEYCGHQVYPTADTPFEATRTPLRDWFYVMYQFCASRNGVAAKEVERQLGVTYKTAWRMCHEIRKYMAAVDGDDIVGGPGEIVQLDETHIGGKQRDGRGISTNKTVVMGMMEKGGNLLTRIIPNVKRATVWPVILENVAKGSVLHTDELTSHKRHHPARLSPPVGQSQRQASTSISAASPSTSLRALGLL